MDLGVTIDRLLHPANGANGHRRAGGDDAGHAFQAHAVFNAVAAQRIQQRRRAENVGDPEAVDGLDQLLRIGFSRPGWVHVGHDSGHAQGRVEKCERRKRGQADFTGFNAKGRSEHVHLGIEVTVPVDHAFRYAGAARSEQDGRHIVRLGGMHDFAVAEVTHFLQLFQVDATQAQLRPGGYQQFTTLLGPAHDFAREVCLGHSDKRLGRRFGQALLQGLHADTGINQNRDGAGLEQGEEHGEKLEPGSQHQRGAGAGADAIGG
jgi:hypothetical protein